MGNQGRREEGREEGKEREGFIGWLVGRQVTHMVHMTIKPCLLQNARSNRIIIKAARLSRPAGKVGKKASGSRPKNACILIGCLLPAM